MFSWPTFRTKRMTSKFSTRKYRLLRRSRHIAREIFAITIIITVSSLLAFVMIFLYNYTISSPYFRIREVIVRGCRELTEKDVLALASIKPSCSVLSANTDAICRRITMNPWVKDVAIGRKFPDRLILEVRERTAFALLEREDGFYLMDTDGTAFKKLESSDDVDVPVLTGCHSEGKVTGQLLPRAIELLRCLTTSKTFPPKGISEIHGDETFGLSLFTTTGLCLQLGFDCYENKLKRLIPVMADLERRSLNSGLLYIDLCDPTKITIQRKNVLPPVMKGASDRETRSI